MPSKKPQKHSATFKAQVALAALRGDRTINELAALHKIHPNLIYAWKKLLLAHADVVFADGVKAPDAQHEILQAELFQQIGRLNMEIQWLKKKHHTLD